MSTEGYCRACLNLFDEPTDLLQYCESNRRMFVYCTGIQVKRNDSFTFQLCKECYLILKFSCKFKKQCRAADKKFKSYLTAKRNGDSVDFSNYLKHIDDTITSRILTACSSTPAHHKDDDDDDNESICTSIQNFMSDMLQGEDILTEAKIIREVIQEEVDILDDSLDSHWLQDDVSVCNDLDMDFNFAGFSTPHSINNDHYYTPRRLTDEDENYYPKDTFKNTELIDMPLLENNDDNATRDREYNAKEPDKATIIKNDMPLLDECNIEFDGIIQDDMIINDFKTNHVETAENPNDHITVILNKGQSNSSKAYDSPLTKELNFYTNKMNISKTVDNDNSIDNIQIQNKVDIKSMSIKDLKQYLDSPKLGYNIEKNINLDSPVKMELDQYIKAELKKKTASIKNKSIKSLSEKCSIDRNLEIALKNEDGQEFSLDQLLNSPQVSIRSGASTPTINNILFGNITPSDANNLQTNKEREPDSASLIEEFLKENIQQSTQKEPVKTTRKYITVKDLNKLKVAKKLNETGKSRAQKRGYKDISRLKDLVKVEKENQNVTSDTESSISEESIHPLDNKNDLETSKQDIDNISISNLLTFDEGQSIDLNYSIASDFLLEDKAEESKESEFKKPFSPPDNKYDLDKNYCKICDKMFKNKVALKVHFVKAHKVQLPRAPRNTKVTVTVKICPHCGKQYRDNSNFHKHVKQHEFPASFICKYCTLGFPTRGRLNQHMKCHADEISTGEIHDDENDIDHDDNTEKNANKKYVCTYCGKDLKTSGNYNLHMRRHTGNYSLQCNICQKGFFRKYDLDVHMLRHNNEKPFACEFCPKKYRYRRLLVGHMYKHLGKEKFKCHVCDVQFVSMQNLKQHNKSEMCANNRKALDVKDTAEITVTYTAISSSKTEQLLAILNEDLESNDAEKMNKHLVKLNNSETTKDLVESEVVEITQENGNNSVKNEEMMDIVEEDDIKTEQSESSMDATEN